MAGQGRNAEVKEDNLLIDLSFNRDWPWISWITRLAESSGWTLRYQAHHLHLSYGRLHRIGINTFIDTIEETLQELWKAALHKLPGESSLNVNFVCLSVPMTMASLMSFWLRLSGIPRWLWWPCWPKYLLLSCGRNIEITQSTPNDLTVRF